MRIIDVVPSNVVKTGFFCKMSQRSSVGYRRKLDWLEGRFAEGLRIKLLDLSQGGRGFIEYIPGEYAWRPVHATGYLFIHCLWVVGKSKGQGFARRLLAECVADARRSRAAGVAVVTNEDNWLIGRRLFLDHGFAVVDSAPSGYELLATSFDGASPPSFPDDWQERAQRFGSGLTVVRSDQCPYLDDAVGFATASASDLGVEVSVVELRSAEEIRSRSPSPYGVFSVVLDGSVVSHTYLPAKKLVERIREHRAR